MGRVEKRVYIGNIPSTATEKELKNRFKTLGKILSVNINQKKTAVDVKTFAFINISIDPNVFEEQARKLSCKPWEGNNVKIEVAKESFLTRLKREREDEQLKAPVKPATPQVSIAQVTKAVKRVKVETESESESDSSSEEVTRDGIRKFAGIGKLSKITYVESENENDNVNSAENIQSLNSNTNGSTCTPYSKSKLHDPESSILSRFESFNEMWKDSDSDAESKNVTKEKKTEKVKKTPKANTTCEKAQSKTKQVEKKNLTKMQKTLRDDERRRTSVMENFKMKSKQQSMIKNALANLDSSVKSNKKIVFNDDEGEKNEQEELITKLKSSDQEMKNARINLFENSDNEDENFEITIKNHYEGVKGQKLLSLQSTFKNDERFKMDERFLEDDEEGVEKEEVMEVDEGNPNEFEKEKENQLKLLESVLGHPLPEKTTNKSKKKSSVEMLRYDPSKPEHSKFIIEKEASVKKQKLPDLDSNSKKRKESEPAATVTKDRFYKVSDSVRMSFKEKDKGKESFSLLKMFGRDESEDEEDEVLGKYEAGAMKTQEAGGSVGAVETCCVAAMGVWKEPFFFTKDDPRFEEGDAFVSHKSSEETEKSNENFSEKRVQLREILRLSMKKQLKRKNPFKNKVGGMKKGQKYQFSKRMKTR